jgi:hypothetical protein
MAAGSEKIADIAGVDHQRICCLPCLSGHGRFCFHNTKYKNSFQAGINP